MVLSAAGAYAADAGKASNEISFLVALLALVLVGRLLGEAMNCIGQPSVMGQLFAGILLGPSALGVVLPDLQQWLFAASKEQASMLDAISQFGILLLLLLTGMETDLKLVRKVGKTAISISLTGVAVPFVCGLALGWLLPESLLPQPERRLLPRCFSAPPWRFPLSRSWQWWCVKWNSADAISDRLLSVPRSWKTRSDG